MGRPRTWPAVAAIALAGLFALGQPAGAAADQVEVMPVPWVHQIYNLDCEAAALQMLLAYEGIAATQDQILGAMGADPRPAYYDGQGRLRWGNAFQTFVGRVNGSEVDMTGYGTYWPVVAAVAGHLGGQIALAGSGISPEQIYSMALSGRPAEVWVTANWSKAARGAYLSFDGATWVPYAGPVEHTVVVSGASDDAVLINDPARGRYWVAKSTFEAAYATYGQMAVVMEPPQSPASWVGTNLDGRLEFFLAGQDHAAWHGAQTAPNSGWSCCASLGGHGVPSPVVASNADGRLDVFARASNGEIWHASQDTPDSGWGAWRPIGGAAATDPVVARNQDGRLELFWVGTDQVLWHAWQVSPGGDWSCCGQLGSETWPGRPAASRNLDGRLELFVRGSDGQLWHAWQVTVNSGWSAWSAIGGSLASDPAVSQNLDGRLEVFARDSGGRLVHGWQNSPSAASDWTCCGPIGTQLPGTPVAAQNVDGRIEIFWRGSDNQLWHAYQVTPNGSWTCCQAEGGTLAGDPAVGRNQDGRLEAFWVGADGRLWHNYQAALDTGWVGASALTQTQWPVPS